MFRRIKCRQSKNYRFWKFAFTLTELLLVVSIISVLAALLLPKYLPQAEKARISEATATLAAITQAEKNYYLEKGVYLTLPLLTATSTDWAKLGLDNPNANITTANFGYAVQSTQICGESVNGAAPNFIVTAIRQSRGLPSGASWIGKNVAMYPDNTFGPPSTCTARHPLAPCTMTTTGYCP
jgi:prepilin-type N-terminal cleavage/methylation domain-containing protein